MNPFLSGRGNRDAGTRLALSSGKQLNQSCAESPASSYKPHMYLACGTEDSLLEDNRGLPPTCARLVSTRMYEEWSGQSRLDFLGLGERI